MYMYILCEIHHGTVYCFYKFNDSTFYSKRKRVDYIHTIMHTNCLLKVEVVCIHVLWGTITV